MILLEPIKTALASGDHAKARTLRAELLDEQVRELLEFMSEPMGFMDGPPTFYIQRVESFLDALGSLGIPEES